MTTSKPNLLVGTDVVDRKNIDRLSEYSTVYTLADLMGDQLARILPTIDVLLVFSWPRELTQESLGKMTRLKFVQSILAGVNHIPFASLTRVSSLVATQVLIRTRLPSTRWPCCSRLRRG